MTPHDEEQQRQQRLDALSQLAATAPGLPPVHSAPPLTNPTAPRPPRWLFSLVVLLIVALLAGAGYVTLSFFHPGSGSAPPIPMSLTIDLDATVQLDCPQSVLWAPDGTRVAVFGSQCAGDAQVPPPYLAVFDARTGKKVKAFDLGTLLSAYGMIPFSQDVAWSRDSTYLVVDGALTAQGGASGTPGTPAALVLPLDGSHPHTLTGSPEGDGKAVWNVRAGTMASVTPLIQPLALSYQWSSDGHISPDTPFPGASPAGSYTGRPTGSADFSFWQTGQIQAVWSPDATTQQQPSFEVFTAFGSQWSPDRQFLAQSLVHEGVVGGQGHPDQVACAAAGRPATCTLTALPFPDAAFAVVVHAVQQAPNTLPNARTGVSWSPDGKLLATVLPADELSTDSPGSSSFVTLLDVATGQPVKHLRYLCPTAPSYSGFRSCSADSPVWSPTGQQIALLDTGAMQLALLKV